jgi:hypothetical protein
MLRRIGRLNNHNRAMGNRQSTRVPDGPRSVGRTERMADAAGCPESPGFHSSVLGQPELELPDDEEDE